MTDMWLSFVLKSDATFGRGEGVAGLVDEEVEHDAYGMPYLRGRTLKGLLVEECANLLHALKQQAPARYPQWPAAAGSLFGSPGSLAGSGAVMRVGDARLPADLRQTIICQAQQDPAEQNYLSRVDVLAALTAIRRQTAMDEKTGRPQDGSLRAMRVILRKTPFEARLQFSRPATELELALLSACTLALRRAGSGRNRGRGRLKARLLGRERQDITSTHFKQFQQEVQL